MYQKILSRILEQKKSVVESEMAKRGVVVDWEEQERRRFVQFASTVEEATNKETWYYDDGSIDGLKIAEFWLETSEKDGQMASIDLKYLTFSE